jgi:hypothetical protein
MCYSSSLNVSANEVEDQYSHLTHGFILPSSSFYSECRSMVALCQ